MNPVRVFAKMAERVPPFITAGGATGKPDVDPSEAAALCSGLAEHPYKTALFLWSGDRSSREWVRIELHRKAMELSHKKWKYDDTWNAWADRIKGINGRPACIVLADYAMLEAENPAKYSPVTSKINAFSIKERTWYRHVRSKYSEIANILDEWANDAYRHVAIKQADSQW